MLYSPTGCRSGLDVYNVLQYTNGVIRFISNLSKDKQRRTRGKLAERLYFYAGLLTTLSTLLYAEYNSTQQPTLPSVYLLFSAVKHQI